MVYDLYPSRQYGQPQLLQRQDPIVYGTEADGPLTKQDLKAYEEKGFLMFEKLFTDDEVQVMREELKRVIEEKETATEDAVIREPHSDEIRSVFDVHRNDSFFKKLSMHEKIANVAQQLLGSYVYVHQSRINFKPGFKGKEFYWHSDFETWHVEDGMPRMRAVSCSIILTDNDEYNGPLMLVPGSHRSFISCVGQTPDAHYKQSLKKQEYGVPDEGSLTHLVEQGGIETATGPAGSVIFFECNTMHASSGNLSPFPRSNVFYVFNSVENKVVEPFHGKAPRPEFLGNRSTIEPVHPVNFTFDHLSVK